MRTHPPTPNPLSHNQIDRPLSRKERRGKVEKTQPLGGKVHGPGRAAVPAAKHQNYRRG